MTKKEIIERIKYYAKEYHCTTLIFSYKGENKAAITLPKKEDDESWAQYLRWFYLEKRDNDSWLSVVKFGYGGSVNILFDWLGVI